MKSTTKIPKQRIGKRKEAVSRKTSIIFTQLGLVLALFFTYMAIESSTEVSDTPVAKSSSFYEIEDFPPIIKEKPPVVAPKKQEVKPEPKVELDIIDILKDDDKQEETGVKANDTGEKDEVKINIDDIPSVLVDEIDTPDFSLRNVQFAPVFPGCKGSKEEIKKCFNASIHKFVGNTFNADIAQETGLEAGKIRINVQFVVDKNGEINDVLVRAPHKILEKEARRVVQLLPKIKPGKQGIKPVGVRFNLPILLNIEEF